jgi:tetratricopeptide (TPR) repeat protein
VQAEGPLAPEDVERIGVSLAEALAAVHAAGLLHRDVKAQNVIIEDDGRVVLMDFSAGRDQRAAGGEVAGTPLYLAPELFAGGEPSIQSDIYSLGVLLFHLLTGTYPVVGGTVGDLRDAHRVGAGRSLASVRSDLPGVVVAAVTRALSPAPSERFVSARAFGEALAGPVRILSQWVHRHRFAASAAGLLAAAVLAGSAWSAYAAWAHPAFAGREWVLLTTFENRTSESHLAANVRAALENELTNSRVVSVVPAGRVNDALALMRLSLDTPIDAALGRKVCLRDAGIQVLVTGSVEQVASTYVLSASIVNPASGQTVDKVGEAARNAGEFPAAIRRLASAVRTRLGESRADIARSNQALERVSTPSMEALRLYSESYALGYRNDLRDNWQTALRRIDEALSIDPGFAAALTWRAWCLYNTHALREAAQVSAGRAMALTATVTEWEKYWIEATYYSMMQDREKGIAAYKALLELRPDHDWAARNLTNALEALNRPAEALPYRLRLAEQLPNKPGLLANVIPLAISANDWQTAREVAARVRALTMTNGWITPYVFAWTFDIDAAWANGSGGEVRKETDRLAASIDGWSEPARSDLAFAAYTSYLAIGRTHDAERAAARAAEQADRDDYAAWAAFFRGDEAVLRARLPQSIDTTRLGWAWLLTSVGRTTDATRVIDAWLDTPEAAALNTRSDADVARASVLFAKGNADGALALLAKTHPPRRDYWFFRRAELVATILLKQGHLPEAAATLHEIPDWIRLGYCEAWGVRNSAMLADIDRRLGRTADAEKIESDLRRLLSEADADFPLAVKLRVAAPH